VTFAGRFARRGTTRGVGRACIAAIDHVARLFGCSATAGVAGRGDLVSGRAIDAYRARHARVIHRVFEAGEMYRAATRFVPANMACRPAPAADMDRRAPNREAGRESETLR
jgi:hypothetical protein